MNSKTAGYRGLHNWVERQLGKPMTCWNCGTTEKRRYAWANKSGEYKQEESDWERLCYPCHYRKDKNGYIKGDPSRLQESCSKGHPLSGSNLYIKPSNKARRCKTCQMIYIRNWWKRKVASKSKGENNE